MDDNRDNESVASIRSDEEVETKSESGVLNEKIKDDAEVPEELIKKKKARIQKLFTEDDLTSKSGLKLVYKTFPENCKRYGQSKNEGKDLNNLINLYKEWSFRLYPGLAFTDMLNRAETFGSKGAVKVELTKLRGLERKRYLDGIAEMQKAAI